MKAIDFFNNNPELVVQAQQCESKDEFISLAQQHDIKFDDMSLNDAYEIINGNLELSEDKLEAVAGGKKDTKEVIPPTLRLVEDSEDLDAFLKNAPK